MIEKVYNIRLYLLIVDPEATAARKNSKTHLSVLQLYSPQRSEGQVVHLLLTDESDSPRAAGNQYTHAHLIKRPVETMSGVRCGHCHKFFTRKRSKNDRHKCHGEPTLHYPGGPMARQLTVWEEIEEEVGGLLSSLTPVRAQHHVFWRVDVTAAGDVSNVWATTNSEWLVRIEGRVVPSPARTWSGPKCFDGFYSWACMMQRAHCRWWERRTAQLRKHLTDLGHGRLADKVMEYGRNLPCVTMPLDLKATSHLWLGAVDDRSVIRSAGEYRSVVTTAGIHFLSWASYETPDKKDWDACFPDASGPGESLVLLRELWQKREADFRAMPASMGGGSHVELFRGNVSLAHMARIMGYAAAEKRGFAFYLPRGEKEGAHVEGTLRKNMAGGPTYVFDRVVDGRKIVTFDANSLYAWALAQDMPVGRWTPRMRCSASWDTDKCRTASAAGYGGCRNKGFA
jgi:hypothetical protein